MWTRFFRAWSAFIDLLLPPACLLCGQLLAIVDRQAPFCPDCLADIRLLCPAHCPQCAQPFPDATASHLCGACLKRPPPFSTVHAAGLYQGTLKNAVQNLKYRNQISLAPPLGEFLAKAVTKAQRDFNPDRIVPVPLHPKRLKQRGYNQALELARPIARQLAAPLDTSLLQRCCRTQPQQGLSASERRTNLRNAFTLNGEVAGLRILLVDDVMTTGETARECCRTLLLGGAAEVQVAVIGRA